MAKQKKSRSKSKKSQLHKLNSRNVRLISISAFILMITGFVGYLLQPEYLGEQLPPPPADAIYKQPNMPIENRVNDLLSRMTLEEKIGQMMLVDKNSLGKIEDVSKYYIGGIMSGAGSKPENNSPQGWLDFVNSIKQQATESRLGIPVLYGIDANHGHANVLGATVYPHFIGLGASNDEDIVNKVAAATSEELVATGVNWSFSPSLDAPKDMRWGRVYEAFSDDPALNSKLGSSYIRSAQTPDENNSYVLATAKHYLANGAMEWGQSNNTEFQIDQGRISANETLLTQEYLPPFKAAVDADVSSVMIGLNQWGDQRVIDSKYLITDKLKNELGFEGFVVSDWYGVYEYAKTSKYDANVKAINAGLDMAMLPYDYKAFLKDVRKAISNDDIDLKRIDDATRRILYQKFKAGLFDIKENNFDINTVGSEKHRTLAREAVSSSAVLLKNDDDLLPISKDTDVILLAGSGADNIGRQSGAWTVEWQGVDGNWMPGGTSILQGVKQIVGENTMVNYSLDGNFDSQTTKSKVGIAVVSEKPYAEGWGDNAYPTLEKSDLEAIANLKKYSEKVVVVILSGRPLFISDHISSWDALVAAWLPGSEGIGIADVLFGNKPFRGRLPVTWPADIQQVPVNADGSTNNHTQPLFKRSFGL